MMGIPRPVLALGLAGVIPFITAAVIGQVTISSEIRTLAHASLTLYAVTILAFMSGCIWAFAANEGDVMGYALSTLPALYGFAAPIVPVYTGFATPREALVFIAVGFVALLVLDIRAWRRGQTPPWWLWLRFLLTTLVVPSILIGTWP